MTDQTAQAPAVWRSRITGHGKENPGQLLANPKNWKIHPKSQQDAVAGVLDEVGFVKSVIVNQRSGYILDGHLRVGLAVERGESEIDVEYVDLTEEEEALIITTLDYTAGMSDVNQEKLIETLQFVKPESERNRALVSAIMRDSKVSDTPASGGDTEDDTPQIFDLDTILDAAVAHYRAVGFPYPDLPLPAQMQHINRLAATDMKTLLQTGTGAAVADTYHRHRFHAAANGRKSPVQAFEDDKALRKAIQMDIRNGAIIQHRIAFLSLVNGVQGCSNFRPGFALYMYRRYAPPDATVLDTSTGYGGRLVGFFASGLKHYIGIDPNTETHNANLRMASALGFGERITLYNQPAEDVDPKPLAGTCDFAFTSPPYFAKEIYSNDDTQSWKRYPTGEGWRDGFLYPMMRLQFAALKPGSKAVVNIADVKLKDKVYPLEAWTLKAAQDIGFVHVDTFSFPLQYNPGKDEMTDEPVFIFEKPEAVDG